MKKNIIIIIIAAILIVIAAVIFMNDKPCAKLNEEECRLAGNCVSTLVPCTDTDCTSDVIFKECKDKE